MGRGGVEMILQCDAIRVHHSACASVAAILIVTCLSDVIHCRCDLYKEEDFCTYFAHPITAD